MSPRHVPAYWSSCCGALAEYIGFYRCRECQSVLSLSHREELHITSDPAEAGRIRAQREALRDIKAATATGGE